MIKNFCIISDFFGYAPNFHDFEITKVNLDRNGPDITMTVYMFETTSKVDKDGKYKLIRHCLVDFKFEGVLEMELKDFNIQNVIFDLEFVQEPDGIRMIIDSSYGLNGFIFANKVSIANLSKL